MANIRTATDSLFRIGNTHKVCQDYAMHSKDVIVLSDGCSSSPNTDLGSRFMCLSAMKYLAIDGFIKEGYDTLGSFIVRQAANLSDSVFVDDKCLDATLLLARFNGEKVSVFAYGDGTILVEKKDGTIEVIRIVFESGAPFYLSYKLDPSSKERYDQIFPGKIKIGERELIPSAALTWEFDPTELKSISLCSDGFDSFLKDNKIPFELDVKELLGFKNTKGAFLDRRLDRYLIKQLFKNEQVDHYDDFSMATMLFMED